MLQPEFHNFSFIDVSLAYNCSHHWLSGKAITFLFAVGKQNVAKGHIKIYKAIAQANLIWIFISKFLSFQFFYYWKACQYHAQSKFVAAWKSCINFWVQLFLYFCKELHKLFSLTNANVVWDIGQLKCLYGQQGVYSYGSSILCKKVF